MVYATRQFSLRFGIIHRITMVIPGTLFCPRIRAVVHDCFNEPFAAFLNKERSFM